MTPFKLSIALAATALSLCGQTKPAAPANPLSAGAGMAWGQVNNVVLRAAEKMPEENYSFKPSPDVRSFGQILGHIADGQYTMCAALKGVPRPQVQAEKTQTTKAALIAALKESGGMCDAAIQNLTDAKATEMVAIYGQEFPRLQWFYGAAMHGYEHYGNLATYMRIKGLVPPSSEPRK